MRKLVPPLLFILAAAVIIFGFFAMYAYGENYVITQNIRLINPPAEVLSGRVESMVLTSVYSPKDDIEIQSVVVNLCSGETWTVPSGQIDTVQKWLKSNLAPHKGCD